MNALLVLVFSGLKMGKLLAMSGTMLLSIAVYAWAFGWRYAVGFVFLLFCHEMGHFVAARQRGLAVGMPTFIPFVGAWINMQEMPKSVETEAYVGIAGPLAGTAAALVCYFAAREFDSRLLMALAYAGFFLNLFNLIPVSPLDGGRITAILSPRVWFLGIPILAAAYWVFPSPLIIIIGVLAVPQLMAAWRYDPRLPQNARYYGVALETRLNYGAMYLGLVVFLALMTYDVHRGLESGTAL